MKTHGIETDINVRLKKTNRIELPVSLSNLSLSFYVCRLKKNWSCSQLGYVNTVYMSVCVLGI